MVAPSEGRQIFPNCFPRLALAEAERSPRGVLVQDVADAVDASTLTLARFVCVGVEAGVLYQLEGL